MDNQQAVMEDITNFPENANQTGLTKDASLQKMDVENEPLEERRSNAMYLEAPQDTASQTRNQTILQLLKSYSSFVNESSDVILDMDIVLNRLTETTRNLKPPTNASERTMKLWDFLLELDKPSVETYGNNLKSLPEPTLANCVLDVEKLHLKLMMEFNTEMKRGKRLGIISADNSKFK